MNVRIALCHYLPISAIVSILWVFSAVQVSAATALNSETLLTARWGGRLGEFSINADPGQRLVPEDFDLGEEILIPDGQGDRLQFFSRKRRTWRAIAVGTKEEIAWKAVRDRAGTVYYLPVAGLGDRGIYVVPAQGGPVRTFGRDTLDGPGRYLATDGADRLAVVDSADGVSIFTLQGHLMRYVSAEPSTLEVRRSRDGIAYTASGELLVFYRVWDVKKPSRRGIHVYTRDGTFVRDVPGPHLERFIGVDRLGQVYTVDDQFRTVRVVTPEGQLQEDLALPKAPALKELIADQSGAKNILKVDADGTLYQLLGLKKKGLLLRRLRRP
jgi:hypothetical protein